MSILQGFFSLGSKINKYLGKENEVETMEGVVSDKLPELKLEMKNDELLALTRKWKKVWEESEVYAEWQKESEANENYWKGKQYDQPKVDKTRPLVDNVIFESLETYLPQVTRRNPDPTVQLSHREQDSKENLQFAQDIQKELAEIADEVVLRLKLKKAARHWALYLLGALKPGWDLDRDIPTVKVIRPSKLILDPNATVDEDGYSGSRYGEYRKLPADQMIAMLESVGPEEGALDVIKKLAVDSDGQPALGTELQFIEWWTDEYMCWEMDHAILLKKQNPHWNYPSKSEAPYNEMGQPQIDQATGQPQMVETPGINHFPSPKLPIILLSVFNLGKQPIDETSLVGQNLASQDLVNKRLRQIDKNADSMNGGMIVSLGRAGMTKEQAGSVSVALRKGGTVVIPDGSINDAIQRSSAPALPSDVYVQLQDTRTRMRDIFGTRGSSAAGLESEKTVRGKMQNRLLDTDRIGGGFSEYLEQMADSVYNWFVQLLYVYDERYIGKPKPKIKVSVKEGSLLPKDSLTLANQAIDLAGQNRMSLIDLYKALDYPNPEELAANVWLEQHAPEVLLGNDQRVQQVLQNQQNAANKPPSTSINFKDLPPDGQSQLAEQAGIKLHPEAIAAFNADQKNNEVATEAAKRSIPTEPQLSPEQL